MLKEGTMTILEPYETLKLAIHDLDEIHGSKQQKMRKSKQRFIMEIGAQYLCTRQ